MTNTPLPTESAQTEQQTTTNTPLPTESDQTEKSTSKEPDGKLGIKITDESGNADGKEEQEASLVAELGENSEVASETAVVSKDDQKVKTLQDMNNQGMG